jgi:Tfp pilus assembly protein PilX
MRGFLGLLRARWAATDGRPGGRQAGVALPTALMVLVVMGMLSGTLYLGTSSLISQSREDRGADKTFSLTESAMNVAAFRLGSAWPEPNSAMATALVASGGTLSLEEPNGLATDYSGGWYKSATFSVSVWDNAVPDTSPPSLDTTRPRYDANDDGVAWVQAMATANGVTRTVQVQLRSTRLQIDYPNVVMQSGQLGILGGGVPNDPSIRAQDASNNMGTVVTTDSPPPVCKDGDKVNISPCDRCVSDNCSGTANVLYKRTATAPVTADQLRAIYDSVRAGAGTYIPANAGNLTIPEGVVVSETPLSCAGTTTLNSPTKPGLLIINANVSISGECTYWGLVYVVRKWPWEAGTGTDRDVDINGGGTGATGINGGLYVEGKATFGGNGRLSYSRDALDRLDTLVGVGSQVVKDTWREVER